LKERLIDSPGLKNRARFCTEACIVELEGEKRARNSIPDFPPSPIREGLAEETRNGLPQIEHFIFRNFRFVDQRTADCGASYTTTTSYSQTAFRA